MSAARPKGRIYVTGGNRGGAGKSTTAHLLALRLEMEGTTAKIIEVDAEARLNKIFGDDRVTSKLISNADLISIMEKPELAFAMWEEIGELLEAGGDIILDLGGNLSVAFADWAKQAGGGYIGEGEGVELLVLCSGDPNSIRSAQETLSKLTVALPAAKRWLVVNPIHAQLDANSETVRAISKAYSLAGVIEFRRCASPVFGAVLDFEEPFSQTVMRPFQDFVGRNTTKGTAAMGRKMLVDWLSNSLTALDPLLASSSPPSSKANKAA